MKLWKLECHVNGHTYDTVEIFYFKTEEEAVVYKLKHEKDNKVSDGTWISGIALIKYILDECDYEEIKDTLTIEQYERLFNTSIKANNKLHIDDFEEGMWVWNQTESTYQQLRYICKGKDYRWVDSWGNIIENDDIYFYPPKGDE